MEELLQLLAGQTKLLKLKDVIRGLKLNTLIEREVQRLANKQVSSIVIANIVRTWTKQVDAVYESKSLDSTQAQAIAQALTNNAIVQLGEAAKLMLAYPRLAGDVARAKENDDVEATDIARESRERVRDEIKRRLMRVGAALSGKM